MNKHGNKDSTLKNKRDDNDNESEDKFQGSPTREKLGSTSDAKALKPPTLETSMPNLQMNK